MLVLETTQGGVPVPIVPVVGVVVGFLSENTVLGSWRALSVRDVMLGA